MVGTSRGSPNAACSEVPTPCSTARNAAAKPLATADWVALAYQFKQCSAAQFREIRSRGENYPCGSKKTYSVG